MIEVELEGNNSAFIMSLIIASSPKSVCIPEDKSDGKYDLKEFAILAKGNPLIPPEVIFVLIGSHLPSAL